LTTWSLLHFEIPAGLCTAPLLHGIVEAFTKYPGLAQVGSLIVAVNCEYEQPTSARVLRDQDEVAFVPPVSGG